MPSTKRPLPFIWAPTITIRYWTISPFFSWEYLLWRLSAFYKSVLFLLLLQIGNNRLTSSYNWPYLEIESGFFSASFALTLPGFTCVINYDNLYVDLFLPLFFNHFIIFNSCMLSGRPILNSIISHSFRLVRKLMRKKYSKIINEILQNYTQFLCKYMLNIYQIVLFDEVVHLEW